MRRRSSGRWTRAARDWIPRWWRGDVGLPGRVLDVALGPAEAIFRVISDARNLAYDRGWASVSRAEIPVISIGNIGVGGAGKTPFAAWVGHQLLNWGHSPAIVLRGYGADELLMHRELNPTIPVFAEPRRAVAVRAAAQAGCTVAVLDDGFQHRALARDLDLLLISIDGWTSERKLLPRGPWREGDTALARAHVIVLTNKSSPAEKAGAVRKEIEALAGQRPVVVCRIEASAVSPLRDLQTLEAPSWLRGASVVAVASLADPRPFTNNLRDTGAQVELLAFPDHHEFTSSDAHFIENRAAGRSIVMTHKEAVKLRALMPEGTPAFVLHQSVHIDSGADVLETALRNALVRFR